MNYFRQVYESIAESRRLRGKPMELWIDWIVEVNSKAELAARAKGQPIPPIVTEV